MKVHRRVVGRPLMKVHRRVVGRSLMKVHRRFVGRPLMKVHRRVVRRPLMKVHRRVVGRPLWGNQLVGSEKTYYFFAFDPVVDGPSPCVHSAAAAAHRVEASESIVRAPR
ncbi:hypothetical protein NDU88_000397 [Pleurodeles waltl]|uniref:Uncharacterized protein n=1 Tax=Pleurodeles waltl TaxID=8319 RepID=A0AAV7Q306_PLEWA|nr:hypothetical protein NDU88_000397 [Pleurodeles waltl]